MTNTFVQYCQPNIIHRRAYNTGGHADHEGASEWTENFIDPRRGTRFVGPIVVPPEPPAVAEIEPWVDPPIEIEEEPTRAAIDERALDDFNTLARGARL